MDSGDEVCYNSFSRTVDILAKALKIKRIQKYKTKVNETSLSQLHISASNENVSTLLPCSFVLFPDHKYLTLRLKQTNKHKKQLPWK